MIEPIRETTWRTDAAAPHMLFAKPPAWMSRGKCAVRHADSSAYLRWDEVSSSKAEQAAKDAAIICSGCPVKELCLSAALAAEGDVTARHRYGIYGGKTPAQRAQIAKESVS